MYLNTCSVPGSEWSLCKMSQAMYIIIYITDNSSPLVNVVCILNFLSDLFNHKPPLQLEPQD